MLSSNTKYIQEMYNIVKHNNPDMLSLFNEKINNEYIIRNQAHLKLCPKMLIEVEKIKCKGILEYIIIESYSQATFKYKEDDEIYTKKMCKNERCNYAHTKDELRKPICILHLFDCCDKDSKCCKYKHTKDDSNLPNVLINTKKYSNKEGKEIFKCFYYTNSVQVYFYETKETIVLNIKDNNDRDKLYQSLIEMN
jgi:hypothetical protein